MSVGNSQPLIISIILKSIYSVRSGQNMAGKFMTGFSTQDQHKQLMLTAHHPII